MTRVIDVAAGTATPNHAFERTARKLGLRVPPSLHSPAAA
jgi:hypothetical protein